MYLECRQARMPAPQWGDVATNGDTARFPAFATSAELRSHPRWMSTIRRATRKLSRPGNGRVDPAICPFRFLFAVYQAVLGAPGGWPYNGVDNKETKKTIYP